MHSSILTIIPNPFLAALSYFPWFSLIKHIIQFWSRKKLQRHRKAGQCTHLPKSLSLVSCESINVKGKMQRPPYWYGGPFWVSVQNWVLSGKSSWHLCIVWTPRADWRKAKSDLWRTWRTARRISGLLRGRSVFVGEFHHVLAAQLGGHEGVES